MRLYLVRHGEAKSKSEDPERSLNKSGRKEVARVAAFVQSAGVQVHQIRHSGKLRAEETASIMAEFLNPTVGVVAIRELAPQGDVGRIAELLSRETNPLMFVGHLPFMDRLVALLVAGDRERPVVRLSAGATVCLEREATSRLWSIRWIVTPNMIP